MIYSASLAHLPAVILVFDGGVSPPPWEGVESFPWRLVDWAMLVFCFGLGGFLLQRVPRLWRGERADRMGQMLSYVGGPSLARSALRAGPILGPFVLIIGVAYLAGLLMATTTGRPSRVAEAALAPLSVLAIVALMSLWSVILFNRPRFLVPPFARHHHGLIGDLLRWIWHTTRGDRDSTNEDLDTRRAGPPPTH